jgi:hypothetical protein
MNFVFGQEKNFSLLCPLHKANLYRLNKDQDKGSLENPYIFIGFLLTFME